MRKLILFWLLGQQKSLKNLQRKLNCSDCIQGTFYKDAGALFIPPDTAATLRDCVKRTSRALATVNRLRERQGNSAPKADELLQQEACLDSCLMELFFHAAKIFLLTEEVKL